MQGAQKTELRGVYGNTLSGAVCSATQQMSVFEQPFLHSILLSSPSAATQQMSVFEQPFLHSILLSSPSAY